MCQKLKLVFIIAVIVVLKGSNSNCTDVLSAILPLKYKIFLDTNIHEGNINFSANVRIQVKILKDIKEIQLDSGNLTISNITLLNDSDLEVISSNIPYASDSEKSKIKFNITNELIVDQIYVLVIEYTGILSKDFYGYYDLWDSREYFIALFFQNAKFRHFCPSFDDMNFRTVFEIEVKHHISYYAISNSNEVNSSEQIGRSSFKITKFLLTERIPTSSVAIVVSKFKSISTAKMQKVEIYGNDSYINACYLKDAMDTAFDVIKSINEYLKPVHNLSSLKLVTVPDIASDISSYELIIYNQYHLIYQSARMTTTQVDKMLRSIIQTFAQQFFGNIMSMSSPQDTFITGGFARFYEFLIADELKPDDHAMKMYKINTLHRALEMDSLITTNQIAKKQGDDIIQYADTKFFTLLKMFEKVIGTAKLQEKILSFTSKFKFQATTAEQFFEEFEEENLEEFNLTNILKFWAENPGYPVIEIVDRNETSITIVQRRFLIFSNETTEHDPWTFPLTYYTSNHKTNEEIILMSSEELTIDVPPYNWTIFNVDQIGYYRVNYDTDMWMKIISTLNSLRFDCIPVLNRAGLIDDAFNLAIANKIPYGYVFGILSYLRYETDLIPWKAASHGLEYIDMKLAGDEEVYEKFRLFVIEIVEPIYSRFGLNSKTGETSIEREFREIAIFWMCKMKKTSCLTHVNSKFIEFVQNPHNIHPDIQLAVLCNAIRFGDYDTFMELWNFMLNFSGDREILIKSLACTEDFASILYIENQYNNEKLSSRDRRLMLINFVQNYKYSIEVVATWIDRNWMSLDYSEKTFMLNTLIKRIYTNSTITSKSLSSALSPFTFDGSFINDEIDIFVDVANFNLNWLNENREEIRNWLDKHMRPSVTESTPEDDKTTQPVETTDETTPDGTNCLKLHYILIFVAFICQAWF